MQVFSNNLSLISICVWWNQPQTFGSTCVFCSVHAMGKRPRSASPAGIQPTAMKALRAQGVSLEVIAGAYQMDVAEVERILEQEEPGALERVVVG